MKHEPDSRYAAMRLVVTLALMTIGSCGMYVVPVVLPSVQADFGVARADASLPYTLTMIGFGVAAGVGIEYRSVASKPATPGSATVGMSGAAA